MVCPVRIDHTAVRPCAGGRHAGKNGRYRAIAETVVDLAPGYDAWAVGRYGDCPGRAWAVWRFPTGCQSDMGRRLPGCRARLRRCQW